MSLLALWGLKENSLVNALAWIVKFGVLLFFLIYSFIKFHPEYLLPLFPHGAEGVFRVCHEYMLRGFDMHTSMLLAAHLRDMHIKCGLYAKLNMAFKLSHHI